MISNVALVLIGVSIVITLGGKDVDGVGVFVMVALAVALVFDYMSIFKALYGGNK